MKRLAIFALISFALAFFISRTQPVVAAFPLNSPREYADIVGSGVKAAEPLHTFWKTNDVNWLICALACDTSVESNPLNYKHGAIMALANFSNSIYQNPPASTYAFVVDTAQTLGFAPKTAYAQGVGFSGLSPLLPLWKVFRNIAYFLMAIVMVAIGFMVMFRKKIDPKTVVTVQNALPRVVITLILITFSYAIVGIMIDLMYFVILLMTGLVRSTGFLEPTWWQEIANKLEHTPSIEQVMTSGTIGQVWTLLFPGNVGPVNITLTKLSGDIVDWMGIWTIIPAAAGAIIGFFSGGLVGAAAGGATGYFTVPIIVQLILLLALLFIFVRLVILFLSSYINIVLALLIGPLQLLLEAVPGGNGFESWFKNLFSNIIVFPVSATMFLIAMFFMSAVDRATAGPIWSPPYGIIGGNTKSIAALFAIGILSAIPSVVGSIKEAIKAKSPVGFGGAFSPIVGIGSSGFQMGLQYWMGKRQMEAQMRGMEKYMQTQQNTPPPSPGGGRDH